MTKEITPEQRRAAAQKAAATYREHRQKWAEKEAQRKAEKEAQLAALRRVRDDPGSPADAVIRAVELLREIERR